MYESGMGVGSLQGFCAGGRDCLAQPQREKVTDARCHDDHVFNLHRKNIAPIK